MHHKASQVPQETYHRLYWYAQRNVDPHKIAATLNLSLKTVQHLLDRLKSEKTGPTAGVAKSEPDEPDNTLAASNSAPFLDLFVFSKTRYTIIDLNGCVCKETVEKFKDEIIKIAGAGWIPLALRMADALHVDASGIEAIFSLFGDFKKNGRYLAILDPSPGLEPIFKHYDIESKIPIFGTERAFEDHAFS
jgi:anti-anti-sigma regulatory factor